MSGQTSWLWPDHVIGKRESRRLREQHNALANSHAELFAALCGLKTFGGPGGTDAEDAARLAIAKAAKLYQ